MKNLFNYGYVLEQNRFAWIDYARGICIILVCYRHSFEGMINANFPTHEYPLLELMNSSLVTFRMALFFIISGLFVSRTLFKKGYKNYVIDRCKIILFPLLVWGTIQITLQLVFSDYINAKRQPVDYLNLLLMPRKIDQFWYLNTLFMVGIIYAFLKQIMKFKLWQLMLTAVLFYALGAYFYKENLNMRYEMLAYSFIPDVLHYFIFFMIGDLVSHIIFKPDNNRYLASVKLLIPIFIIFLAAHYYYTIMNARYNKGYYVEFYMPVSFLFIALSGCAVTIQLSFLLQKLQKLRFLRVIGYHSLYIYLMHIIITGATRAVFSKIFHIANIPLLLIMSIVAGIVIPILAYNFLTRNGMWWLFSLKRPDEEINYHRKLALQ